jgi:transcriptional regulator with XRE-family HTH domain
MKEKEKSAFIKKRKHYYSQILYRSDMKRMTFGRAIRISRIKNKLTLHQLKAKSGVAFTTIANIEAGRHLPSPKSFVKLCKAMKLDFALLYALYYREMMTKYSENLKCSLSRLR